MNESFEEAVDNICRRDARYQPEAYHLVREALDFATRSLQQSEQGLPRHVTGGELLEGIKQYTLREFGPMSLIVLQTWGLTRTEDFGEIVFNLVEAGKLGKEKTDSRDDFAKGYDFFEVFALPYEPKKTSRQSTAGRRRPRRSSGRS